MDHIREDGHVLINPTFAPQETEENMHSATKEAVGLVKDQLKDLTDTYNQLMTLCQQKRDFFIVCVKFHMTTRQVFICTLLKHELYIYNSTIYASVVWEFCIICAFKLEFGNLMIYEFEC